MLKEELPEFIIYNIFELFFALRAKYAALELSDKVLVIFIFFQMRNSHLF